MFELGQGVRVRVAAPEMPVVMASPPVSSSAHVVPVVGPAGPAGPAGDDSVAVQELIDVSVASHAQAAEPHTAYDDLPSLSLIFDNGLV